MYGHLVFRFASTFKLEDEELERICKEVVSLQRSDDDMSSWDFKIDRIFRTKILNLMNSGIFKGIYYFSCYKFEFIV